MSQASAEGKSSNAGSGNNPARHCQTKDMRGMIDITPRVTSSNAHRFRLGINLHIADEREVDDQAIITDSQPSGIVASAPYGNQEIVLARKVDRRNDVGHIRAVHNQSGMPVNHAVVDFTRCLISSISWLDEFASQGR